MGNLMEKKVLFIVLGLVLIGVIVMAACVKEEPAPTFDDNKVTRFVRLYLGLTNVSVEGKEWKNGEWAINVSAKGSAGMERLELRADANLSSFKAYEIIKISTSPPTYQDIYGQSCKSDKSLIDIYVDPYDPWSRTYFDMINNVSDIFSESAVKKFHIVNPYTSKLEGYKWAVETSQYLACIKNDSDAAFIKMTRCVFDRVNSTMEILNATDLDSCASASGTMLSNESLKACVGNESIKLLTDDGEYALSQMGDISTTYVVIDCRYETFPTYIDVVMCHLYPDLPACKDVK